MEDAVVAEVRKIREKSAEKMRRNPEKYQAELRQIEKDVKKYGIKKAFLMRKGQSTSK